MFKDWFSGLRRSPTWNNARSFVNASVWMMYHALPDVRVVWSSATRTAFADQDNGTIVISSKVLSYRKEERTNPDAEPTSAITFLLGCIAHEASHFLFSPKYRNDLCKAAGIPHTEATGHMVNVLEDLFIEDAIMQRYPWTRWMITGVWEYLFPADKTDALRAKWDGEAPTMDNIGDVLNVITGWKNRSMTPKFQTKYEEELYLACMSVIGEYDLERRGLVFRKVYEVLFSEEMRSLMEMDEQALSDLLEELKKLFERLTGEGPEITGTDMEGNEVPNIKGIIAGTSTSDKIKHRDGHNTVAVESAGKTVVQVWDAPQNNGKVNIDARFTRLGDSLLGRGTVRTMRSEAKASGPKLTHIHNLFTRGAQAGKIFSGTDVMSLHGRSGDARPNVMILVDSSGSMMGEEYEAAISAAAGAIKSLTTARVPVACYGFTTADELLQGEEHVRMIRIKDFADSYDVALQRLNNCAGGVPMNNNPDAEALLWAGKRFRRDGSDNIVIVISDGRPVCHWYGRDGNDSGIAQTQRAAKEVRASGVRLLSIAINDYAYESCKAIYGEDATVRNDDPNIISEILDRILF